MEQHPKYQISLSNNTIGTIVQNYGANLTTKYDDNLLKPIFFNIQEYIPSFTGRFLYLKQLDESILENQTTAICGFGGIGKSELVRYYAWEKFDGNIVWINAETHESMNSLFKKLALELLVPIMQDGIDRLMDAIIRDIYNKLNRKKCLVILDNAINQKIIGGFLPRRNEININVIITSQNREWNHNRIDLDVLTPEECEQFFKFNHKTLYNNLEDVEKLAQELQYLPIALQQAASYIKYKKDELHEVFGVLEYIKEFEKKPLFEDQFSENLFYDKTVLTTVSLAVDLIRQTSKHPKLTLDILHVCAYLAPDNIPKFIFSQLHENTDVLNEAIHVLIKYSLLREFFNDEWCYNIHRMVQLSYRYLNNPEGCKTTIRESLFLTTRREMRRSPHSNSVLCFIMKHPPIDYGFYFDECPNQDELIFHLGFYDYFDAIKYLLKIIKVEDFSMGVEGAIENGSIRIVEYICKLHPKLFDLKTPYLAKSASFGKINLMRYFLKNGADVNQLYKDIPIIDFAIVGNMKYVVKFLIKEKCIINYENMQTYAPMFVAVVCKNLDILKILHENGGCVNTKEDNNNYLLHFAVQHNYLPIIQYLTENGAQINCMNKSNHTPLHYAALNGHLQIVEYLIEKGADLNILSVDGLSALYVAASSGHLHILQLLHKQRSDINLCGTDEAKSTALMAASGNGHIDIVKYLLDNNCNKTINPILYASVNGHLPIVELLHKNGFQINVLTNENFSPLYGAAQNGHLDIVKFLLKNGADINQPTTELCTPLIVAAQNNHEEVVRFLIENEADINFLTQDNSTALFTSCFNGHLTIVQFLLENGADINQSTTELCTPLIAAAQNNHKEVVCFLVENGADVNFYSQDGVSALIASCFNGHLAIVKFLLNNNSDFDHVTNEGYSGLFAAAYNGHFDVVQQLIEVNCDIYKTYIMGCTALHVAALQGHLRIVKFLYETGLDLEDRTLDGRQAIHLAAENGHLIIVEFLLENGSPVDTVNNTGVTPLILAAFNGHHEVVKFLLDKNSDFNHVDNDGYSGLFLAAQNGHVDVVKQLIEVNCDIYKTNKLGFTALHVAAEQGHLQIVELLYKTGFDLRDRTLDGSQAIHLAAENGHFFIVEFLLENGSPVDTVNNNRATSLDIATLNGHLGVVKHLLDYEKKAPFNEDAVKLLIGCDINEKKLLQASHDGQLSKVKILIKNGADVNTSNNNGFTPLYMAALNNHKKVVEYLLQNDAKINQQSNEGCAPIYGAAIKGHYSIIEYLLQKGADINIVNNNNCTPIYVAAQNGHEETVELLKEKGCDIFCANSDGFTPFYTAALNGHLTILQKLNKYDVNIQTRLGFSALYGAVLENHPQVVAYLIELGADVNLCDCDGITPLHVSVCENNINLVKYLISKGGDPNLSSYNHLSPIYFAIYNGFLQIVEYLLDKGVDTNILDKNNCTPLHVAVLNNHVRIVEKLIQHGTDYNKFASSILFDAVLTNNIDALNILHGLGVDLNHVDNNGSGLHQAAQYEHLDCIEWFLEHGTDVNILDENHNIALHWAVASNCTSAIQLLVLCNADINIVNLDGVAPINMDKSVETTEVFLAALALINNV